MPCILASTVSLVALGAEPPTRSVAIANTIDSYVRFDVVAGRLAVANLAVSPELDFNIHGRGREEILVLSHAEGGVWIRYVHRTADRTCTIEADGSPSASATNVDVRVRYEANPGDDGASSDFVSLEQSSGGPIRFEYRSGGESFQAQGTTVWHVILSAPELIERELLPVLRLVHTEWDLVGQARRIESSLYRAPLTWSKQDYARWRIWIDQLSSPRFVERESADARLRALGAVALPFLMGLGDEGLDAEQQHRIRGVLRWLPQASPTEPAAATATWLAGDPAIWCVLLRRADAAERPAALAHLDRLLGDDVRIDFKAQGAAFDAQLQAVEQHLQARVP